MKQVCKKINVFTRMLNMYMWNSCNKQSDILMRKYRQIKSIFIICIVSFFTFNCEKAISQSLPDEEINQKRQFIAGKVKQLYEQKTKQPDTLFKMKPKLNEVTKILSSDTFQIKHVEVDKDLIRKLLHEQSIYDYQVHYIKIPLKNLKSNTIEQQIKEHELVKEIIENPYANRMGVDIEVVNDEYLVHLLFAERYIDFDEGRSFMASIMDGGGDVIKEEIIKGKSHVDNLYYNNIDKKVLDNTDYLYSDKKEVELDQDNRFSIRLRKNPNVYFLDENGKILANQNFLPY